MLHHRLAIESNNCTDDSADLAYSVEQVPRISTRAIAGSMLVLDLAGCILVCSTMRIGWAMAGHPFFAVGWLVLPAMLWLACAYTTSLYKQAALRAGRTQILAAMATTCLAFAPALRIPGIAGIGSVQMLDAFMCQLAFVAGLRLAYGLVLRLLLRRGFCLERVLLLAGTVSAARVLCARLERRTRGRLRVAVSAAKPHLSDEGALSWLETLVRSQGIDRILLAHDCGVSQRVDDIIAHLARSGAAITVVSESGAAFRLCGQPSDLPSLHEHAPPLTQWQLASKRSFDICLGAAALLCLSPLLLLLAVLIRLDSKGSVFFSQIRQGLNGKSFRILKFRTMYVHMADQDCTIQTTRDDTRVTRIGRLLRSTSLDELPQLLNVLRGDMSIIGPRPHALGMTVGGKPVASAVSGYEVRLRFKPGITGWAQVNGSRGEVSAVKALRQRVALDCHYMENWSLKMDALILWRTVLLIFRDEYAF